MKSLLLPALLTLAACDWQEPASVTWEPHTYEIKGSVLSGEGGAAAATVTVKLFEVGCKLPLIDSAVVANTGAGYAVNFGPYPFARPLCARVKSDTWPGATWDEVVVVRDSITPDKPVIAEIHYDFAVTHLGANWADTAVIKPSHVSFEIVDVTGSRTINAASLPQGRTLTVPTGSSGRLTFNVRINAPAATSLATLSFDARPDTQWFLSTAILPSYNRAWCFCRIDAFPIQGQAGVRADSLFLFWGSGRISAYWVS